MTSLSLFFLALLKVAVYCGFLPGIAIAIFFEKFRVVAVGVESQRKEHTRDEAAHSVLVRADDRHAGDRLQQLDAASLRRRLGSDADLSAEPQSSVSSVSEQVRSGDVRPRQSGSGHVLGSNPRFVPDSLSATPRVPVGGQLAEPENVDLIPNALDRWATSPPRKIA